MYCLIVHLFFLQYLMNENLCYVETFTADNLYIDLT
jgi:hypothetical protein